MLLLAALTIMGSYYTYDSIAPIAAALRDQRGCSQSQIGLLNAVFNLPNIALALVGGIVQRGQVDELVRLDLCARLAGPAVAGGCADRRRRAHRPRVPRDRSQPLALARRDATATANSWVFAAATFATPVMGLLADHIGRRVTMLALAAALMPLTVVLLVSTGAGL